MSDVEFICFIMIGIIFLALSALCYILAERIETLERKIFGDAYVDNKEIILGDG